MNFDKCYKLIRSKLSQIEARQHCSEQNTELLQPKTHIESEFIESFITDQNTLLEEGLEEATEVWVGFRQVNPEDPVYFSQFEGLLQFFF